MTVTNQKKIAPEVRAMNFALLTRQYKQVLPTVAAAENGSYTFQVPKVRLISKIRLLVTATLTVTHAGNVTYTPHAHAPFNFLRNVRVELNNGFIPFNISGRDLYFYNLLRGNSAYMDVETATTAAAANLLLNRNIMGCEAGAGGVANPIRFMVDIPITLNDRDPVGLIVGQNEDTVVTVTVDFNDADVLIDAIGAYTLVASSVVITPMVETFSAPAVEAAIPDLSILKAVHKKTQSISGAGVCTLELPVGTTYRKLMIYIEDAAGGEFPGDISGDFELLFNQADTPYRIRPWQLAGINEEHYGDPLPQGLFVFDFAADQGLPNYSGTRDYIDTSKLTEFWFRFTAAGAGNITAIYEHLSRLA